MSVELRAMKIGGICMKRCSYCGKKINGSVGFCSDACESRYKKVMEKMDLKLNILFPVLF